MDKRASMACPTDLSMNLYFILYYRYKSPNNEKIEKIAYKILRGEKSKYILQWYVSSDAVEQNRLFQKNFNFDIVDAWWACLT